MIRYFKGRWDMFQVQGDPKDVLPTVVGGRLAAAVVTRLADHVPGDVMLLVDDAQIALAKNHQILAKFDFGLLLDQAGDIRELAEMAVRGALSTIQDVVVEELTTPWPAIGSGGPATTLPLPDASRDSNGIRLWFGDETAPALALQPITLEEMGLGES
jgi:hypothetical protein